VRVVALRIEKNWAQFLSFSSLRKKESVDTHRVQDRNQEESASEQNHQQRQGDEQKNHEKDKQSNVFSTVQKGVLELQSSLPFTQTGIRIEMIDTPTGLAVRLLNPSGNLIKLMAAEDFLKLKEKKIDTHVSRGKILDQKF